MFYCLNLEYPLEIYCSFYHKDNYLIVYANKAGQLRIGPTDYLSLGGLGIGTLFVIVVHTLNFCSLSATMSRNKYRKYWSIIVERPLR